MNMYTSSELATKTKMVCDAARSQGCAIISTNGKADLAIISLGDFETINEFVHMYDSWLGAGAVARMRRVSADRELSM
ncbi:MAG: hypothetical protein IKI39_00855, partial [Oscillospiraceae bacterium]|nr:hypothetical protein [Oscillospiraceae bacterium]